MLAEYITKKKRLTIGLKGTVKHIINGEVVVEPGIFVRGNNHRILVDDKKIEEMLDKLIMDRRMGSKIMKKPSQRKLNKMIEVTRAAKDAADKVVEEARIPQEDMETQERFDAFTKRVNRERVKMTEGVKDII
jgi:hypothetical protein